MTNATCPANRTGSVLLYEVPTLDPGINEALLDYIARREREIPAAEALNQEY